MLLDTPRISSRLDLLYLVTREFNAGLEIDKVLYNVLSATVASVGAADAGLFLVDPYGELEHCLMLNGFETQNYSEETLNAIFSNGPINWVLQNNKPTIITNTQTDDRWYKNAPAPAMEQVRSTVTVPIRQTPDVPIGVLIITSEKPNYFDDNDMAVLTIIADQAAFALANARLFKAEQHRRRLADTLISIAHTINSSLDLNEVLNLILEQLALVVDYDSSSIFLYEEDTQALAVQAARGFEDMDDALKVRLPFDDNIPNYRAILEKKPLLIGDLDEELFWQKSPSSENVKGWIGAPLIARDQVVGILTVDSLTKHKYSPDNVSVVTAFADLAATAVANAQTVTKLQHAEASYGTLFEDSTDMIIITDYQGEIQAVNRKACQMIRRPKDAIIRLNIAFIAPQLKTFLAEQIKQLQAWRDASIEIEILDAYRQKLALEINVRHIQFVGKDRVEWVGRDISARKEIERMRQDLVNMLVHDLRGPIGNLINTIELVTKVLPETPDNATIHNFLEMGKRTGRTLTDLVDSMLDVSRLEQGQVPLQRSMTSLKALLQEVEEQVLPQTVAKRTQLTIHPVPEEPDEVWLDNNLIRRVLTNLIGNAIKYSPEKARVELTTAIKGSSLHFTVTDTGPGISKQAQNEIFNKFSRVSATAANTAGVGLGLAFCKLAVEAHHGKIYVESNGIPGEGSAFYVILPIEFESD